MVSIHGAIILNSSDSKYQSNLDGFIPFETSLFMMERFVPAVFRCLCNLILQPWLVRLRLLTRLIKIKIHLS